MTPGFWIQVVGSKKSGKTSLLEGLTRELVRRGRTVCFIKHTHEHPVLDGADTDTERLRRAGAATTILAGESSTITFRAEGGETLERIAHRDAGSAEILLAEGFRETAGRKIAIAGGDLDIGKLDGVIAVVGEPPEGFEGRTFSHDQTDELCDMIESELDGDRGSWSTSLTIDGRVIPLNVFVQDVIASGIMGMSAALEGVDGGTALDVRCRRTVRDD